jgi:hypothetical protein
LRCSGASVRARPETRLDLDLIQQRAVSALLGMLAVRPGKGHMGPLLSVT